MKRLGRPKLIPEILKTVLDDLILQLIGKLEKNRVLS